MGTIASSIKREKEVTFDTGVKQCCCDSRSYCVRCTVPYMGLWQTIQPVSVTSLRTAGSSIRFRFNK